VIIARNPVRFRPLMIPSVFEKFSYAIAGAVLVSQGRMSKQDLLFVVADALWGVLFVACWVMTGKVEEKRLGGVGA
jgi:hypothetical protein